MAQGSRTGWLALLGVAGVVAFVSLFSGVRKLETRPRYKTSTRLPTPGTPYPPLQNMHINSPFGDRVDPVTNAPVEHHQGIDLQAAVGTPVYAPVSGTVSRVDAVGDGGPRPANGNAVHIRESGTGRTWSLLHLSRSIVGAGTPVQAGQLVGYTGQTGKASGPHLHLAVAENGVYVDPARFYPSGTFT